MLRRILWLWLTAACAPAVIAPGHRYQGGHKLVWVEGGATLSRVASPLACLGPLYLGTAGPSLAHEDIRLVLELTVRVDGTVDSITVINSTYPAVNDPVVRFFESCSYQPALSETGSPVATRVQVQFAVARLRSRSHPPLALLPSNPDMELAGAPAARARAAAGAIATDKEI